MTEFCHQSVTMEISDLLIVEETMKAELKFALTTHMVVSVLTFGMRLMLKLSVDN